MNIFDLLKKDHKSVKELLNQLIALDDKGDEAQRDALVSQIRDELIPHARAEEAVFYNPLRAMKIDNAKLMHAYKEHLEA